MGLKIVPVGLNFESRQRFRSRVLLSFGVPILAAEYRQAYMEDPYDAAHRLTAVLQEAIRRRVVNIRSAEFTDLVQDIEAFYKAELMRKSDLTIPGGTKFKRSQMVSREIARALDYFFQVSPEIIWRLDRLLKEYRQKLERLRLKDAFLRQEKAPTVGSEARRLLAWVIAGSPLAVFGVFWNYLPYKVTGWLTDFFILDATKVHSFQILAGGSVFLLWYGPLLYFAGVLGGPVTAGVLAVTAPLAGLFARWYFRQLSLRRQKLRLAYLELKHGYDVQMVRQQRRQLMGELDNALAEYLKSSPRSQGDQMNQIEHED
jgi:hypothetical protein